MTDHPGRATFQTWCVARKSRSLSLQRISQPLSFRDNYVGRRVALAKMSAYGAAFWQKRPPAAPNEFTKIKDILL